MLQNTVAKWDYQPDVYEDGDQAWLAISDDAPPHLLLLDWEMPGMSGIEVCKRVRELENSELFHIVMLSSRVSTEDLVKGLEAGANDYISKPFMAEELKARLDVGKRMVELQEQRVKAEHDKRRLQRELLESRKMEALGQVTGSIAHDFNNILGIIMGYTSMTISRYRDQMPEKMLSYLEASLSSTERAKELVAKMLTFAHAEADSKLKSFQIGPYVSSAIKNYKKCLPENISMELLIHENLPDVLFDESKIAKIINILSDNAVESMPDGGSIQVKVSLFEADQHECSDCHRIITGQYIGLEVMDQGHGIDAGNIERVFEPFFTTKEFGKGMGLAMLHGLASRNNCHTLIEQLEPTGTRVRVVLPITD